MTDITAVRQELSAIAAALSDAADKINSGVTLDLADLGPRAQQLCEQILRLPPHEAIAMLGEMTEAVEKLNMLTEKLKNNHV
jgi:hypothetical protein